MSVVASRFRQPIFQNGIQVEAPTTQPDQFMLAHQFSEYHATRVHASREQVYKAMRSVTAAEGDSEHCRRVRRRLPLPPFPRSSVAVENLRRPTIMQSWPDGQLSAVT